MPAPIYPAHVFVTKPKQLYYSRAHKAEVEQIEFIQCGVDICNHAAEYRCAAEHVVCPIHVRFSAAPDNPRRRICPCGADIVEDGVNKDVGL